jgi:hypothetical protein
MPAKSKQQQRFFGVVKAMQTGDIPKTGEAGKVAKSMSKSDVSAYAGTNHEKLPYKVRKEDVDIGHVDDEPGMIKADLYRVAKYAVELYKLVSHLQKTGKEIDFPHWWQADIIIAKECMVNAKHYLQGELAVPKFDNIVGESKHKKRLPKKK